MLLSWVVPIGIAWTVDGIKGNTGTTLIFLCFPRMFAYNSVTVIRILHIYV
jgi:hypothetical protein